MSALALTPEQRALATLAVFMATEAQLIGAYRALFEALRDADAPAVALAQELIDRAHARHIASIDAANQLLALQPQRPANQVLQ